MASSKVFVLSPAHCGGERAAMLFNDLARFELARRLRTPQGATIGETFRFLSGLYFRGKLEYAHRFAAPPAHVPRALVITTNRGLISADEFITLDDLRALGSGDINVSDVA